MKRAGIRAAGLALVFLGGCVGTSQVPTSRDEVPASVWAEIPASTPLEEIMRGPDGCFWYLRHGPLETVWVVVRDIDSIPVCDPPRPRPEGV